MLGSVFSVVLFFGILLLCCFNRMWQVLMMFFVLLLNRLIVLIYDFILFIFRVSIVVGVLVIGQSLVVVLLMFMLVVCVESRMVISSLNGELKCSLVVGWGLFFCSLVRIVRCLVLFILCFFCYVGWGDRDGLGCLCFLLFVMFIDKVFNCQYYVEVNKGVWWQYSQQERGVGVENFDVQNFCLVVKQIVGVVKQGVVVKDFVQGVQYKYCVGSVYVD